MSAHAGSISERARARMVSRLSQRLPDSAGMRETLRIMGAVPRHAFIESVWHPYAYQVDGLRSLPLGYQQTISRPSSVAKMTAFLADYARLDKVLEIGTGSGYQTAVLSRLFQSVFTIERIAKLQQRAKHVLEGLHYDNICFLHGDGYEGWHQPMRADALIITAVGNHLPQALVQQLNYDAVAIMPLRRKDDSQHLVGYVLQGGSVIQTHELGEVRFVELKAGVEM